MTESPIPYVETNPHPRQFLDLYYPAGLTDYPVLIYMHGGVWRLGSKDDYPNIGEALAAQGIGVAMVNYRLTPDVTHPTHAEDVAQAVAWLIENLPAYGGDPTKLFIGGHSAGGHLASLIALDPQYLAAHDLTPDLFRGVINLSTVWWIDEWIMGWARGAFPDDDAAREAASPYYHLHADGPPMLIVAAENDYPELIEEAEAAADALTALDIAHEIHIMPDRDHYTLVDSIGAPDDLTAPLITAWIQSALATEEKP